MILVSLGYLTILILTILLLITYYANGYCTTNQICSYMLTNQHEKWRASPTGLFWGLMVGLGRWVVESPWVPVVGLGRSTGMTSSIFGTLTQLHSKLSWVLQGWVQVVWCERHWKTLSTWESPHLIYPKLLQRFLHFPLIMWVHYRFWAHNMGT